MKFYQIKIAAPLDLLDCEHCPFCSIKCPHEFATYYYPMCCIEECILVDYPNRPDWCPAEEITE